MPHSALIGTQAPSLNLPNYDGEVFTLNPGENGLPVVLFFYPKSGSFACTKEAVQFRDDVAEKDTFKPGKVQVVGISRDPVEKQKEFVEKENLNYPVLSDVEGKAHEDYKVGKGLLGLSDARVTFIIDKKGVVRDALDATINFAAHHKFVAKWLDKLEEEDAASKGTAPTQEAPTAEGPLPEVAQVSEQPRTAA